MFLGFLFELISKIIFFLSGSADPEVIKKRLLKQTAREFARNRYGRFYKVRHEEVTGAMGKFFYDLYKTVAPAQAIMQNVAKSAVLKQVVVEFFLTGRLEQVKNRLTDEAIEEMAKTTDIKNIIKSVDTDIAALSAGFDPNLVRTIDYCYNNILAMSRFITFDFIDLLKKFDPRIIAGDFYYEPLLSNIPGVRLLAELKDFLDVSFAVDPSEDWNTVLQILKVARNGVDVIDREQWYRVLGLFRSIRRSCILELMIRHIDKSPNWQPRPKNLNVLIAEQYLEAKQTAIKTTLDKIAAAQKRAFHNSLINILFGGAEVQRARYYIQEAGEVYVEKNFDGFLYAAAINYLLAFLMDIFRGDLYNLCDFIFIRGKWIAPEFSRETSEHAHAFMELTDRVIAFDEAFSEAGVNGSRLARALVKMDYDRSQRRLITSILGVANEEALQMINSAVWLSMALNKNLSILLEDRRNNTHNLIINWQELESASPASLTQRLENAREKLDALARLMQFLAGAEIEAEGEETGALNDIEEFEKEESGERESGNEE